MNDGAEHDLLAVLGRRAGAQLAAERTVGDVADADRHAAAVPTTIVADLARASATWPGARTRYCSPRCSM